MEEGSPDEYTPGTENFVDSVLYGLKVLGCGCIMILSCPCFCFLHIMHHLVPERVESYLEELGARHEAKLRRDTEDTASPA
ncbi:unnamed protein product, partial [Mesorhabditis spiculigera]